MPKISAPTVGEHRAAQQAALIAAGEELLLRDGLAGVTPRSVCERAGLSRSSFYVYFPSRDDLLAAIAVSAMRQWNAEIEAALAGADSAAAQLRVFVETSMTMAGDGRHGIAGALRDAELKPSRMENLMVIHAELVGPLVGILELMGLERAEYRALLAQGAVGAGIQLIAHGAAPAAVAADVIDLLERGLTA